jgi:hypothetical protein
MLIAPMWNLSDLRERFLARCRSFCALTHPVISGTSLSRAWRNDGASTISKKTNRS